MRLRIKAWLVAAATFVTFTGCQEPKEIVPVAPPGFELARTPSTPQGEGAQAIGEQASARPVAKQNKVKSGPAECPPTPIGKPVTTPSGLVYETLQEGTGPIAKSGQVVKIHYTGTLADGTVFDSSRKKNTPFETSIGFGVGRLIDGWNEGVPGMKVGERRKLIVPPASAYGPDGMPPQIPPNATLTFDIELLEAK